VKSADGVFAGAALQAGFYGKLPAHGDFVSRDLPAGFVQTWDQWLQQSISASRGLLGDRWLEIYLTSPIWHFAFPPGLLDEHAWLGLLSPSVDSVGRYYSLCIATRLPASASAVASLYASSAWLDAVEKLVITALEEQRSAESIEDSLQPLRATAVICEPGSSSSYVPLQAMAIDDNLRGPAIMLEQMIAEKYAQFSYWCTLGSPSVTPCIRVSSGMPDTGLFTQMMDSSWQP
jgi:type VI secretion system protein ImpM